MTSFIPSERNYDGPKKDALEAKASNFEFAVEGSFQPPPDFGDEYDPFDEFSPFKEDENTLNRPGGIHEYDPDSSGQRLYDDIFKDSEGVDQGNGVRNMDLETVGESVVDSQAFTDKFRDIIENIKGNPNKSNFEIFLKVSHNVKQAEL